MPSRPITDHDEIRRWATSVDAVPVEVIGGFHDGEPAILRFTFGTASEAEPTLRPISWESFFAQFDLLGLALAFDGENSYEFVQIEEKSPYRFEGKPV